MTIMDVCDMTDIQTLVKDLRGARRHRGDVRHYIGCWSEQEILNGELVDALVLILRTRGCRWARCSGCTMCGYINDAATTASDDDIWAQFTSAMQRFNSERMVKIYTSGSFLDTKELSRRTQFRILDALGAKTQRVIVESRPEFITEPVLERLNAYDIEVAIGLESANQQVLADAINKGFTVEHYVEAAKLLKRYEIPLKTYLLIKPPFLTERAAIEDAARSAKLAGKYSEQLSFNPVNVQRHTLVEYLFNRNEYRPPWLWSVFEVLRKANANTDVRVQASLAGCGSARGAHNCGRCDKDALRLISEFSLRNEPRILDELDCDCKDVWLDALELERFTGCSSCSV